VRSIDTSWPDAGPFEGLTEKQREVLELLTENRTTKEIAAHLGVSDSAVNQRIEPLRQRLGGITRAELTRRYRTSSPEAKGDQTCELLTARNFQVESAPAVGQGRSRDDRPGHYRFEDSLGFVRDHPWAERPEVRIVPRLLDGKHAGLARGIAMLVMTLLIAACLVLGLAAAQALTDTLG
jgi:DNA-binding CsgD family transcriptional regulator